MNAYDFVTFYRNCPNYIYGTPVTNRFEENHCRIPEDKNTLVAIPQFNGENNITFVDISTGIQGKNVTVKQFHQFYEERHDLADLAIGLRAANDKRTDQNITDIDDQVLDALFIAFSRLPITFKAKT